MRTELLYSVPLLLQRVGEWAVTYRRLNRLKGTVARALQDGHIDSLELLELMRPLNPVAIFDIGANVGTWTLLARALYPESAIQAFEPLLSHAKKFEESVRGLSNITLHTVALGANNGPAKLHVTDFADASSILELCDAGSELWSLTEIEAIPLELHRLDDFVSKNALPKPDLIKIDVQGFELEVLRGATRVLGFTKGVIAEVSFREFYKGQCRFDQLVSFLAENGLFVSALGLRTALGKAMNQTDVLFLRDYVV
jgi:FkbM family methyltransferase